MLTRTARGNRTLVGTLLTCCLLLLSLLTASPSQATFGSKITITAIRPAYNIPNTIGDYPLVTTGDAFSVDVSTDGWLSLLSSTPLVLTADSGPEAGMVLARTSLPALSTTATFTGAKLTKEALGVRLKAAVDKPNPDTAPGFAFVDVLGDFTAAGPTVPLLSIAGGGGVNKECTVTSAEPYCLEMRGGATSDQLLAVGVCDPTMGCVNSPTFTWLANVATVSKLVFKVHKSKAPGTGVPHFILAAQLTRSGNVFTVADCPSRDTVGPDRLPCQAFGNRFGAGNLSLEVNWIDDGRVVIKN